MIHKLKIESRWLDRILTGEKTAELRLNDRDYQVGDTLELYEVNEAGAYIHGNSTGIADYKRPSFPKAKVVVTHVLQDVPGLEKGYVVLSIAGGNMNLMRWRCERGW